MPGSGHGGADAADAAAAVLHASMIVIGDEILGGYVTDTNSPLLADRLRAHGVPFTHIHVVADDPAAIDEALQLELRRARPRLIVTSGGIGSTPDDITFESIAASLHLDLVEDEAIAARLDAIGAWTREQGLDADDRFMGYLKRMARIPAGSRTLREGDGWLPAVAVDVDGGCEVGGATVVVLPGVPSEFHRLVEAVIEPRFLAGRNVIPTVVEIEHGLPESTLNLAFADLEQRFPQVKLGSYPGRPMLVRLSGDPDDVAGAQALIRDAIDQIEATPGGQQLAAAWAARGSRPRTQEDA